MLKGNTGIATKKVKISHQLKPAKNEGIKADKRKTVLQEKWVRIEVPGYDMPSSYRKSIWIVLKSPPDCCLTQQSSLLSNRVVSSRAMGQR